MDMARGSSCSLCPGIAIDRLGNYVTTYKRGGDVVTCHNHLRNVLVEFCHRAHLGVRVESGSGLTPDLSHTLPADVLVINWERGKHAALDITVTSPLIPSILTAASLSEGAAIEEVEARNHRANDPKLGWVCISHLQWRPIETGEGKPHLPSPTWLLSWPSPPLPTKVRCSQSSTAV